MRKAYSSDVLDLDPLLKMARSTESIREKSVEDVENPTSAKGGLTGTDEDFEGTEARLKLEKKLLRKLDMRMSILIIIYILNFVSVIRQLQQG